MIGGGCSLLRLSMKIDRIKESLDNMEQKVYMSCLTVMTKKDDDC